MAASGFIFAQSQPYVVLISFDGFRWDYSERGITPNIERLKECGVHAKTLKPCFPSKTFPNHYSIITGMYPENHGIISNNMRDLRTRKEFHLYAREEVKNPDWYKGEAFWETTTKKGIISASYFWPGSEVTDASRRPTYSFKYKHNFPYENRIDTVINWLTLPEDLRPHFIATYFHDTDSYGHQYGPNSPEIDSSIVRLDNIIGYFYRELERINMQDSVNVILVSDHGMTEIYADKIISVGEITSGYHYESIDNGPFLLIEPEENEIDSLFSELKSHEEHFTTYTKSTIPDYYHFSHNDLIFSLILVADPGWTLVDKTESEEWYLDGKGTHGYDNNFLDMHGTFIVNGPHFKNGYKTGTLNNIDIYPLLCEIFNLKIDHKIDGELNNIKFILNNNQKKYE
ncbi:MAG: ectonucleotide pyrophosphatase/phosphodiesterase [Bacteroidetes bacterium]|nr:ectonucleotide pyrophosphatase/phosphodiesterase [Bacteroidota bacterium]